ncbi:ComEA family DNA-binding protein [Maribacter algicola]|uniref:ComEA family DNA-binding protein n=1 Tax=Maribacter algicola TaxID=2498892 RepID=UPI001FB1B427|nr:helix-hairpin-helix domain-containing protein [Maribacter algicola]
MKKSHFKFTKQERSGIFFLLLLIVLVQASFWLYNHFSNVYFEPIVLDKEMQEKIDNIKEESKKSDSLKLHPFNPNFISDFKGYTLGLSVDEIDRLHRFRDRDLYVNSKEEFQEVTGVSDSLLNFISPFFKFPEWANSQTRTLKDATNLEKSTKPISVRIKDLNGVTLEELQDIYGVGNVLSERILKFRDRLGGFLLDNQLYDVYGLEPAVAERILEKYRVLNIPEIQKIDINTATVGELSKIVYISRSVAEGIVSYRVKNGEILSFSELTQIENFPADRIDRFPLYLSLKK